jgi:7-cyano-7-deazaguanine synthase
MNSTNRAVCLFSGGPDAIVAAELTRRAGLEIHTLFVDYGQHAAKRERSCAEALADWIGAASHTNLEFGGYSQLRAAAMVTPDQISDAANPISEYVPFRNTMMAAMGVVLAETIQADTLVIGSMAGPWVTPDNNPEYFDALRLLIQRGTPAGTDVAVSVPLQEYTKTKIIEAALEFGVPLELTWSCHNENDAPCLRCGNCRMRADAFRALAATDPLTSDVGVGTS